MKCKHCGKEFQAGGTCKKYCSKECKAAVFNLRRRIPPQTKKCLVCGKEFTGNAKKIYCSHECAYKAQNAKQAAARAGKPLPKCAICGAEYKPTSSTQKYCPACQNKVVEKNKVVEQIKCVHCGKLFKSPFSQTRFCSRLCWKQYMAKQKAEALEKQAILDAASRGQGGGQLNDLVKPANECNLDYGTYRGLIAAGKTHDELKAQFALRNPPVHNHSYK